MLWSHHRAGQPRLITRIRILHRSYGNAISSKVEGLSRREEQLELVLQCDHVSHTVSKELSARLRRRSIAQAVNGVMPI